MSYRDFTLEEAVKQFELNLESTTPVFTNPSELPVSPLLTEILKENLTVALAVGNEISRSMLIVAPILMELRRLLQHRISVFPGIEFSVEPSRGLSGYCDFLICRSPQQLYIEAPIVSVVEAKKDDLKEGLGQCIAEMVAAQLFNEKQGSPAGPIYGVVTTGSLWKPIKLTEKTVRVDPLEYPLHPGKVLGMLHQMVNGSPLTPR